MKPLVIVVVVSAIAAGVSPVRAQAPGQDPPPAPGGRRGAGGGAAAGAGRRGPNFPQQTRPLASAEVLARGKAVYGVNCTACHGADLRGGDQGGPSLLRSLAALSDQHGEEIGPIVRGSRQDKGMPAFNLVDADITAVSEYIHSILAKVGSQARPPGAIDPSSLNILVGKASAGEAYFKANAQAAIRPPAISKASARCTMIREPCRIPGFPAEEAADAVAAAAGVAASPTPSP